MTSAFTETLAVLLPFFNEEAYLPHTLACLARQTRLPDRIILVDNGSDDGSPGIARAFQKRLGAEACVLLHEPAPGKIHALHAGLSAVRETYVAVWDADTLYPPHYLATALAHLQAMPDCVAVVATDIYGPETSLPARLRRGHVQLAKRLFRRQCHGGGYGQVFRTNALRAVGGFDPQRWPFLLEDHEIIHRLWKCGRVHHPADLWCQPSTRRPPSAQTRWPLHVRLLYHFLPFCWKDWFFYRYLASRWEREGFHSRRLRSRPWSKDETQPLGNRSSPG